MSPRLIGYYQSFDRNLNFAQLRSVGLTHVHLASIHFGVEPDGEPYIHLNNLAPIHESFDFVWKQMADFKTCGGKVVLMIGGAGGGYETLLNSQYSDVCLSLLLELLTSKKALIDGVDFDVEQLVNIDKLLRVVRAVQMARPGILLTFAPLASSLQNDSPGMGGFSYKPLLQLGVTYFNGQFYGDWGKAAFRSAVDNGYPADRVVMGCLANQPNATPEAARSTVEGFPQFGGVFIWEIGQALPSPVEWVATMHRALQNTAQFRHPALTTGVPFAVCTLI